MATIGQPAPFGNFAVSPRGSWNLFDPQQGTTGLPQAIALQQEIERQQRLQLMMQQQQQLNPPNVMPGATLHQGGHLLGNIPANMTEHLLRMREIQSLGLPWGQHEQERQHFHQSLALNQLPGAFDLSSALLQSNLQPQGQHTDALAQQLLMPQSQSLLPPSIAASLNSRSVAPELPLRTATRIQPLLRDPQVNQTGPLDSLGLSSSPIDRSSLAMPPCADLAPDGYPFRLPAILARPDDTDKLSSHQLLLRYQIEVFQATEDDINTHTRGRNKPISLQQVGIRCRHCSCLPVAHRQKGSTYFPATLMGIYQAAQNMSTTHMQCGLCSRMPSEIKNMFARLLPTKVSSTGAGRQAWAAAGQKLGLVDTTHGIYFVRDIPPGVELKPAPATSPLGSKPSAKR